MRPRRPTMLVILLLVLGTAVAGCTVGPSSRPAVAVRGDGSMAPPTASGSGTPSSSSQLPPLDPADPSRRLNFRDCASDVLPSLGTPVPADRALQVECVNVPINSYPNSTGEVSTIQLVRASLTGSPAQQPPLLILGDSDGEPGTTRAARLATQLPLTVLQHFQLIGMDRRGTGVNRLDCTPPAARADIVDADPTGRDPGITDALLARARTVVGECSLTLGDDLGTLDTATTAKDVDAVRELLGVGRLNALGLGDGARALTVWADQHPNSVGRLVLDSPPDPTLDTIAAANARAGAAEVALDAFAKDCTSRPGCPLGANPRQAVSGLVNRLLAQPVAVADGRRLTAGGAVHALLLGLDDPPGWSALATALAAAGEGDPTGLLALLDPVLGPGGRFDAMLATSCNDTKTRVSATQSRQLIDTWRTDHPLFGAVLAEGLLACAAWPVPSAPATTARADLAPPILVLGAAGDPRNAPEASKRAADQLGAAFLNWQGVGRGAYPRSPCVTDAVDAMLVNGTTPADGTLCPP